MTTKLTHPHLGDLAEPVYILLGRILEPSPSGTHGVCVLRAPDELVEFDPEAWAALEYFTIPRGLNEAVAAVEGFGGQPENLQAMVDDGTLVALPARDAAGVRNILAPLALTLSAETKVLDDGHHLIRLDNGRALPIEPLTAAVLAKSGDRTTGAPTSLGAAVAAVAEATGTERRHVWNHLLYDLAGILGYGVGSLAKTGTPHAQTATQS